jgi:hypothetical protein
MMLRDYPSWGPPLLHLGAEFLLADWNAQPEADKRSCGNEAHGQNCELAVVDTCWWLPGLTLMRMGDLHGRHYPSSGAAILQWGIDLFIAAWKARCEEERSREGMGVAQTAEVRLFERSSGVVDTHEPSASAAPGLMAESPRVEAPTPAVAASRAECTPSLAAAARRTKGAPVLAAETSRPEGAQATDARSIDEGAPLLAVKAACIDKNAPALAVEALCVDEGVPVLTVEAPCIDIGGAPVMAVDDPRTEDPCAMAVEAPCIDGAPVLVVPRSWRRMATTSSATTLRRGAHRLDGRELAGRRRWPRAPPWARLSPPRRRSVTLLATATTSSPQATASAEELADVETLDGAGYRRGAGGKATTSSATRSAEAPTASTAGSWRVGDDGHGAHHGLDLHRLDGDPLDGREHNGERGERRGPGRRGPAPPRARGGWPDPLPSGAPKVTSWGPAPPSTSEDYTADWGQYLSAVLAPAQPVSPAPVPVIPPPPMAPSPTGAPAAPSPPATSPPIVAEVAVAPLVAPRPPCGAPTASCAPPREGSSRPERASPRPAASLAVRASSTVAHAPSRAASSHPPSDSIGLLVDAVAARLAGHGRPGAVTEVESWYDQDTSPIARRAYLDACRKGELRSKRIGKSILVRRADLDAWIEAHGGPERGPAEAPPPAAPEPSIDELLRSAGIVLRGDGAKVEQRARTTARRRSVRRSE